ncbi:hypothetical protein [Streptomyces sp. NPDC050485]|uniref:hypothetical protein n=1 Tax=Streptomyces sp. NPDC050485 TaxID=3365617 RepID=UPI0037B67A21
MNHRTLTVSLTAATTVLFLAGCAPHNRRATAVPAQTAAAPAPQNCLASGTYQGKGEPSGGVQLTTFTVSFDQAACQGGIVTGTIAWTCATTDGKNFLDGTTNSISGTDRFQGTVGDVSVTLVTRMSGTLDMDAFQPPALTVNTGRLNDPRGRGCYISRATLFPTQTVPHLGAQITAGRRP